jgi:hypothetical protein
MLGVASTDAGFPFKEKRTAMETLQPRNYDPSLAMKERPGFPV